MDVTRTCRDLNALDTETKRACELFLAECKKQGLNVLITETYRSQERQNYLYEQGRTRPGRVVTWTKNSRHKSRRAFDFCKNIRGQEYADPKFFERCGEIGKMFGLTWGGDWKQKDTPHLELADGAKVKEPNKVVEPIKPTLTKLNLNGILKDVCTINLDGYNYIKLRDLQCNKIKVDYDNMPIITTT